MEVRGEQIKTKTKIKMNSIQVFNSINSVRLVIKTTAFVSYIKK